MTEQKQSAAARYREMVAEIEPEIITVTVWSGATMKRIKPAAYTNIFELPSVPMQLADRAVEAWREDGLDVGDKKQDDADISSEDKKEFERLQYEAGVRAINAKQRVLDNSIEPKIVDRTPAGDNEIHWTELHKNDLGWLYQYEASGGSDAVRAAMFPGNIIESNGISKESPRSSFLGIDGAAVRAKAKRASRHKK